MGKKRQREGAAADTRASDADALSRLAQDPASASKAGPDGMLPVHIAIKQRSSVNLVAALLEAYPQGASAADGKGRLPIHWAGERASEGPIVLALLAAYRAGAAAIDGEGKLPVHLAAASRASPDAVVALLEAHPEGARTADASAYRLPLHYAAVRKGNVECIHALLAAHPPAAGQVDGEGDTPADLARAHAVGTAAIEVLARAAAVAALPPPPQHYNADLGAFNVWDISLPNAAIEEALQIYESCGLRNHFISLQRSVVRHAYLAPPDGAHERFFAVRAGAPGDGGQPGWSSDVTWVSVDDEATHARLEGVFRRCDLEAQFGGICECAERLRLYSASFVVRSRCDEPNLHMDYIARVGARALTFMAPLQQFPATGRAPSGHHATRLSAGGDDAGGGGGGDAGGGGGDAGGFQLIYEEAPSPPPVAWESSTENATLNSQAAAPPSTSPPARRMRRHDYQLGRALVFGGGFMHSTEPGRAAGDEPHAYLCFTFGTDRLEHWPLIAQTIDGDQSRMLCRPDGTFVLTQYGRGLQERTGQSRL